MSNTTIAKSDRILLRAMTAEDAEDVYRYRNIPDVSIFQGWTPENPKEVEKYAQEMNLRESFSLGDWYQIIIQNRDSNQVMGDVAVCIEKETGLQAELGIALDPKYQKQGFATEAVQVLCSYLFSEKALRRIHVSIDPRNTDSLNLFARLGFRQEARHIESIYFKGEWVDDIVMALLQREWS